MWLLRILPDWFFHVAFFIGVVGVLSTYLLKFIPIPALYVHRTIIQVISVAIIVLSTFMMGAQWNDDKWQAEIHKLELAVKQAETKAAEVTVQTVTEYVDRTKIVREKGEEIIRYVDREVIKIDEVCKIPSEVISIHNLATQEIK